MAETTINGIKLGQLELPATNLVSLYGGFSATIDGQATILSTQLRMGGKFFWLPLSYNLDAEKWGLSTLLPSLHLSRCELREYIGGGADLGLALPDPLPTPMADLQLTPLLTYKTLIEKFEEKYTTTTFYLGGDMRIGIRILPLQIHLIDVQIFYSVEERLIEIIGSPVDFGFMIPLTLSNAGALGLIPFEGRLAGNIQPMLKLELYWDEIKRWIGFDDVENQQVIDLNVRSPK